MCSSYKVPLLQQVRSHSYKPLAVRAPTSEIWEKQGRFAEMASVPCVPAFSHDHGSMKAVLAIARVSTSKPPHRASEACYRGIMKCEGGSESFRRVPKPLGAVTCLGHRRGGPAAAFRFGQVVPSTVASRHGPPGV